MKYPQITQITQISSCASGHANRTGRAGGVPQVKGCLPAAPPRPREAALHGSDASAMRPNEVSISQVAINPQPKSA
jgi:hypothetical protein